MYCVAREAGGECCDTPDSSPIQHKAANLHGSWMGRQRAHANAAVCIVFHLRRPCFISWQDAIRTRDAGVQLAGGLSRGAPSGFAIRTPVSGPPDGHLTFCSGPPLLRAVDLSKCASEAGGSRWQSKQQPYVAGQASGCSRNSTDIHCLCLEFPAQPEYFRNRLQDFSGRHLGFAAAAQKASVSLAMRLQTLPCLRCPPRSGSKGGLGKARVPAPILHSPAVPLLPPCAAALEQQSSTASTDAAVEASSQDWSALFRESDKDGCVQLLTCHNCSCCCSVLSLICLLCRDGLLDPEDLKGLLESSTDGLDSWTLVCSVLQLLGAHTVCMRHA